MSSSAATFVVGVTALGALLARFDLSNALEHADRGATLLQTGKETADSMRLPGGGPGRYGNGGTLSPAQRGVHLLLPSAFAQLVGGGVRAAARASPVQCRGRL